MRRSTEGQLMSVNSPGDGSMLTLDFTTGVLDPRLTFTRASTATFINSSGLVASASTDVARFDHDPTTLAAKGLLIEGAATNYATGFAAGAWGRTNINGSGVGGALANEQTGADGVANTAARITTAATTTFPTSMFTAFATSAAGNSRTFSVWLRGVGLNTTASIAIVGSSPPTGVASSQFGHSVTLATSPNKNNVLALVTGLSTTAWTRVSISRTDAQVSPDSYRICPGDWTGTISSGLAVDVYVPQVESGLVMSSTIPTVASTVTRAADTAIIAAGANFTSWYQGGTQGTFYADWFGGVRAGASGSTNRTVLSTDDVSTKHLHLMQTAAAGNLRVADFGGANNVTTANTLTSGQRTKGAFAYNGSTANVCLNGGTVATGSSLAFSVTPTWLVIGATSTNGTSITDANVVLNNSIAVIKYWPTALQNATLQSLTT
jgi:hypothetical protein